MPIHVCHKHRDVGPFGTLISWAVEVLSHSSVRIVLSLRACICAVRTFRAVRESSRQQWHIHDSSKGMHMRHDGLAFAQTLGGCGSKSCGILARGSRPLLTERQAIWDTTVVAGCCFHLLLLSLPGQPRAPAQSYQSWPDWLTKGQLAPSSSGQSMSTHGL